MEKAVNQRISSFFWGTGLTITQIFLDFLAQEVERQKSRGLIQNGKATGTSGQRNTHPLLLLFCANITSDVCPRDIFRPPDGLAAFFAPAWFSPTCGVLEHLWNKRPKLGLKDKSVVSNSLESYLGCVCVFHQTLWLSH